ncbi:MAG: alpha-galactosidase, partial [Armatimonadetes bacterium]|nr:alpha-galactosidase [Armatimonadota bacterium]
MRYCIIPIALATATAAFAVDGVTFCMSFDRWMLPDMAAGSRTPIRIVGAPALAPGKLGKALSLDGNSYLEFPAGANVGTTGGTVALWFKPENWGAKTYDNLFGFSDDPDNALHFERSHPGGQFRLVFGGPKVKTTPRERSLFSKEPLRNGEWVHLAATWDQQTGLAQMWINGQQVAAFDQPGMLPLDPPSLLIGCGFGRLGRAVQGLIDELVILDHAATAEEVAKLMEGLQTGGGLTQVSNEALNVVVDQEHGFVTVGSGGDMVPQMVLGPASVGAQIGEAAITPERFEKAEAAPAIAPRLGPAEHRVFETRDEATGAVLRLHVQLQQAQPLALLWLEVRNPTDQPLVVKQLTVLRTVHPGAVVFAAPAERLRIFLDNGSLCGSGSKALSGKDLDHVAHGAMVVNDPDGGWAGSCSFVSFQTGSATSRLKTGADGLPQLLEAKCDYPNGARVAPGEALASEVLAVGSYGPTATAAGWKPALPGHVALASWADTVMAVNDLQPPRFCPSGWNSWYCYRLTITEDLVLENARVIKEKLAGLGLQNMQIDHGWQYRDIVGNWVANDRFPHGLPWLAEKLKEMGFTLGLWTAVTQVSEFAPLFQEHPEAMFQTAEGKPLVAGEYWFWEPHGKTFSLDPTHPLGEGFYRKVGEDIRSYGCVYWKNDFQANLVSGSGVLHDRDATRGTPIYLKAVRAYRDGAGPDVAHMACNAALNPIAGLCEAAWTHGYIGNPGGRWDWLRGFWRDFNSRAHVSGKFYWSDPDYLQVGQGTANENRVRMAFVVFGGGPMFLSDRLPELPDEKIELIKQCLPTVGPPATPLDMFTYREYPQVSHLPVKTDWGQWHILGLFNLDERPDKVTVDLADLGLPPGQEFMIWDYF